MNRIKLIGRFRKGKKAFLTTGSPKLQGRYITWLAKRAKQKRMALAGIQTAMIAAMGAVQLSALLSQPAPIGDFEQHRRSVAIRVAELTIETARGIAKVFNDASS